MHSPGVKMTGRWVALSPAIFLLHFLEEAPGFVVWVNSYVDPDISREFFIGVNAFVLGVTAFIALVFWFSPSPLSAGACTLWLSFIMLANALLHLSAGILEGRYVPGLATAVLLYIPYYILLMRQLVRKKYLNTWRIILLSSLGSVPMFVQGYRVFFLGSRLW